MEDKRKYVKRNLKNISKAVLGSVEVLGGVVGLVFNPIIGIPLTIDGTQRMLKGIRGEYIKDSMINVMSNNIYSKTFHKKENRIVQEFPNPKQLVTASLLKDKTNFLLMQELNFLLGSDTFDKKGNRIQYSTHSQGLTKFMLYRLQKAGMIQDFKCEETKPKALFMERLMLGNINKDLFKKDKMYEMTFSKTDKQITEEDIKKFLKIDTLDDKNYDIKRDRENNIISVNYRASTLIKNRFNNMKDKLLPSVDKPKLLVSSNGNEKNEMNNESREDPNKFSKDLKTMVNKPEEITEKVNVTEVNEIKIDVR